MKRRKGQAGGISVVGALRYPPPTHTHSPITQSFSTTTLASTNFPTTPPSLVFESPSLAGLYSSSPHVFHLPPQLLRPPISPPRQRPLTEGTGHDRRPSPLHYPPTKSPLHAPITTLATCMNVELHPRNLRAAVSPSSRPCSEVVDAVTTFTASASALVSNTAVNRRSPFGLHK